MRAQAGPIGGLYHRAERSAPCEPRYQEWFGDDFAVLLGLLRDGKIQPVVAERLPLTEARRAYQLLEQSASVGKLVLVP